MSNMIRFDSSDWSTIKAMYDKVNELGVMLTGITEEGELIAYAVNNENELTTIVSQKNGWIRTKTYDLIDHYVTEMYSR